MSDPNAGLTAEEWRSKGHVPVEHIGGPYHLQTRMAPPNTNQGEYKVDVIRPVFYETEADPSVYVKSFETREVTYELRTLVVFGVGIAWVGYVLEGYWA